MTVQPSLAQTAQDTTTLRQQTLREVVVSANGAQQRLNQVQVGSEQLQLKELSGLPHIFGQADIMRSVQLLPGVKPESEASTGFQVRGGTAAQNQILYDDAPVYNVGHLAGLFSAFNDDALATATLYKGLIPAQYGGASAAVLDLTARTGNRNRWYHWTVGSRRFLGRSPAERQGSYPRSSSPLLYGSVPQTHKGIQGQHPLLLRLQREAGLPTHCPRPIIPDLLHWT